jgi:hypothetical protein
MSPFTYLPWWNEVVLIIVLSADTRQRFESARIESAVDLPDSVQIVLF